MKSVALEDICDIQIGRTPSRAEPQYWSGTNPWVTISDLKEVRTVEDTKEQITDLAVQESNARLVPKGTLLLSFKLSLGKRAFAGRDLYTNEAIAALQPRPGLEIDPGYLYWVTGTLDYEAHVDRAAKGKTLNKAKLRSLQVPLPPLPEQKRIAKILDAADALRAKRRESLAQLDALLQSTFLEMFGDPVENLRGFEKVRLGDLLKVKSGNGLTSQDMSTDGEYPVYGGNGINGYHDSFMFDEPKLVLGRVGVYCGAVHLTQPKSWVTDNALYVAETFREINQTYLLHALSLANLNQYAGRAAQPLISGSRIYPVEISYPPMKQQNKFETRVKAIASLRKAHERAFSELGSLFASLQHRAFAGQL